MSPRLPWALLGAAALLLVATSSHAARSPAPAPRACPLPGLRALLIGDSLAVGLGPPMAELAGACGTAFQHHAFVGAHVTEWTGPRLDAALAASSPDVALISLGGNDFQRSDPEHVREAIGTLLAKLRAAGVRPLWISPPAMPFADTIGARQMWAAELGGQKGRDWYPLQEQTIHRAPDQIHPTGREYRRLAALLWRWMATETAS